MSNPFIAAFSGGKDSTAMVLRLAEMGEDFDLLFTPAGNEPPEVEQHIHRIADVVDKRLVTPEAPSLFNLIDNFNALPNWRQRWCTRMIKIVPCIAYLKTLEHPTLMVGLRADEEERKGIYGDYATYRYPLREWGWDVKDVYSYLTKRGIVVPKRTDCMLCFGQRLIEWYNLWRDNPKEYDRGVQLEARTGFTFRSPHRDKWPAALADLRKEFESGQKPKSGCDQEDLFGNEYSACRVCKL